MPREDLEAGVDATICKASRGRVDPGRLLNDAPVGVARSRLGGEKPTFYPQVDRANGEAYVRKRLLPRTEVSLSEICFGSMRFVPGDSGPEQWQAGFAALDAALDAGINVIHSSEQYATFDALSAYLARSERAGDLHHIVKVHAPDYDDDAFDAAALRAEIERMLRALNTERITVVQHLQRGPNCPKAHAYDAEGDRIRIPAAAGITESMLELMDGLKAEGKVGSVMSFPHTMPFARTILDCSDIDGIVNYFDVLETEAAELFDELRRRDMGFVAIRPLLQGMLTDKRIPRDRAPADDSKREEKWDPWYELLDAVRARIGDAPASWTDFALRFSLTPDVVTTSVLSLNSPEQVASAVAASSGELVPSDLFDQIVALIAEREQIEKSTIFGS